MKFKTIREGEQAVIRNHLGEGRLVEGPARVFLFRERLQKLQRYTASQYQYLKIKDNSGLVKHEAGPYSIYKNPLIHASVQVKESTKIDGNHVIVVYRQLQDNSVERRIVTGPVVFTPAAEEWLHTFEWHGTDPQDKTRLIPGYKKFSELPVVPDQFYYNVRDVRTNDDTMMTVKLMLFYEMCDVIRMLETTKDPIADMTNAVCADVIAYVGKCTFEDFLRSTQRLSDLKTFPQLLQRAERIGFKIAKVVYRGYHASTQLQLYMLYVATPSAKKKRPHTAGDLSPQAMQDGAIQSRTELRLKAELQEQQQKLAEYKVQKEQDRTKLRQEMEQLSQQHTQTVETLKQTHQLQMKQNQLEAELQQRTVESTAKLALEKAREEQSTEFLQRLKSLEVDVTKYLVNQNPPPVTEELQVVSDRRQGVRTAVKDTLIGCQYEN